MAGVKKFVPSAELFDKALHTVSQNVERILFKKVIV